MSGIADTSQTTSDLDRPMAIKERAQAIAKAGGLKQALDANVLPSRLSIRLSEALVLGLLRQGITKYLAIFGHGSTELAEVLRIYEEAGVTRTFNFRNEVAMAHAGTALAWQYGETPAVVTSIGPGALQAMAGSLAAAVNGVGVYHLYGDETTHGEGYNMQQIPKPEQGLYGRLTGVMGESYVLHTPRALRDALRRGTARVHHPFKAGPFYLLLPLNTQPVVIENLNLHALPERMSIPPQSVADESALRRAAEWIRQHERIVIKAGGGCRKFAGPVRRLAEATGAVVVLSPVSTGVLPDDHPQNMHVGGSKGSISGNYAMENGELLIAVGTRAVCQSDCSGVAYAKADAVININADLDDVAHYNRTVALAGDIGVVIEQLLALLERTGGVNLTGGSSWLKHCAEKKAEWRRFRETRHRAGPMHDPVWGEPVLGQPAAIHTVCEFAKVVGAVKWFDAGDVQANGFQTVEDSHPGETFSESGASYMGFAASALAAAGIADEPRYSIAFSGDGSFMMNPQILIDAVQHRVHATVVIFDNRRMAAISSLQLAQYGVEFKTSDAVAVDYVALCNSINGVRAIDGGKSIESLRKALAEAHAHQGLSVVHVPVYSGDDPMGGLGAYGSWNVGNWVGDVESRYQAMKI
jgi:3D-(3,5/4)-trihydroxycyclohexane-1,2-dione acylhydrolase (decyclizing)